MGVKHVHFDIADLLMADSVVCAAACFGSVPKLTVVGCGSAADAQEDEVETVAFALAADSFSVSVLSSSAFVSNDHLSSLKIVTVTMVLSVVVVSAEHEVVDCVSSALNLFYLISFVAGIVFPTGFASVEHVFVF